MDILSYDDSNYSGRSRRGAPPYLDQTSSQGLDPALNYTSSTTLSYMVQWYKVG